MFSYIGTFFQETSPEGKFFMYVIIAVFALSLAIIVERLLLLARFRINAEGLWLKVRELIVSNHLQEASELCRKSTAPLPRIFSSGLKHSKGTEKQIQNAVDEVMLEVLPELEKRVGHLTILANIATLAGLLGTVFGLRRAFTGVAVADPAQKAGILAEGIATALNATALGLVVAVAALLCYSFIQAKLTHMIDDIDQFSVKFINLMTERKQGDVA
jgi:biopolymer transport protein ExbB/TolQ